MWQKIAAQFYIWLLVFFAIDIFLWVFYLFKLTSLG